MTKMNSNGKPFTFTIQRSRWLRGTGFGLLLDSTGKQCCVGHYLSALGVKSERLFMVSCAQWVKDRLDAANWLVIAHERGSVQSKEANELYYANDRRITKDEPRLKKEREREQRIKQLFAQQNIRVRFTP